jgi:twitching motility protein PilT
MRDLETISAAITAAETGHIVFSILHTIERIIDVFPAVQQKQICTMLANTLQGKRLSVKRYSRESILPVCTRVRS